MAAVLMAGLAGFLIAPASAAAKPVRPRRKMSLSADLDIIPRTRLRRLYLHKSAKSWSPVSLVPGPKPSGKPGAFLRLKVRRVRKKIKGKRVWVERGLLERARVLAVRHPYESDEMLVVSLYPKAWKRAGRHLEIRYLVSVGYLEGVQVVAVRLKNPDAREWGEDSFQLDARGASFHEDYASGGRIALSAVNPRPGRHSFNAASGSGLTFGLPELDPLSFGYLLKGVRAGK